MSSRFRLPSSPLQALPVLCALLVPAPSTAQPCLPLAAGDTVRVTWTFWTPRPEYGLETRSHRVEFGRVLRLDADSLRYRTGEESREASLADSISVARHCQVPVGPPPDRGKEVAIGMLVGAGLGLLTSLCDSFSLDPESLQDCSPREGGTTAALIALGAGVGALVGVIVAERGRGTRWEWVDGTGHEPGRVALLLAPAPHPGSWSLGLRIPR